MSVTFSITINQTAPEALKQLKERQHLATQQMSSILAQLDRLEEQELEDTEEYRALMDQLENETCGGYEFYELQMANGNFATLNNLLGLPTDEGYAGTISAEPLLLKIAQARRIILSPSGKEWERGEEPPYSNGSFRVMPIPGLSCKGLENYLQRLQRIAEYAYANQAEVHWA